MNILLICSNSKLNRTRQLIHDCYPGSAIVSFSGIADAARYITGSPDQVNICFAEVVIGNATSFHLIDLLRRRNKRSKVVLIAPDDRFALEGWRHGMNDYLIEELTPESIRHTLVSCAEESV